MSSSIFNSAAEQHALVSTARIAVEHYTKLFSAKIGVKHFFTREDIEDIAQNVVANAWRSRRTFKPNKCKLSTWIGTIAFNCIKDAIDYKMKRLPISGSLEAVNPGNDDEFNVAETWAPFKGAGVEIRELVSEYSADKEINRREFEAAVSGEVDKLSEKNRRFVDLLKEGYAPRDMAVVEGCTPNAASIRIHGIRHALSEPVGEIAEEFEVYNMKVA
ncbi:MAG: hypothetical protein J5771_04710 [Bacteroidales bacterium]|nr:hypothetical protein [Bacteroidales bacterium]